MATYLEYKIGRLKLNNQAGVVCSLECYYKMNENDHPRAIGTTRNFSLGFSRILNLNHYSIPDGAWVTAYSNVWGRDSHGQVWLRYQRNCNTFAEFTLSGTAFRTRTAYNRVSDLYTHKEAGQIKLNNQSGTVCALQCLYKVNMQHAPTKIGITSDFPLGSNGTLNLNDLFIPNGAWVTAFVNSRAGLRDSNAYTWVKYKKGSTRIAEYTVIGVINFTSVLFNRIY